MSYPPDSGLVAVLRSLDVLPDALLGHGGEAWVYALDDERVVRVLHAAEDHTSLRSRIALVAELAEAAPTFALPETIELGSFAGRHYSIDRRLRGVAVPEAMVRLTRSERDALVRAHLDTAADLGSLHLEPRDWYGDLLMTPPIHSSTWQGWLHDKAADGLRRAPAEFASIDAAALADSLPAYDDVGRFVHLDAFGGNMLAVDTEVTAVIDIGATSVAGDPCLDALSAAVYFCSPQITPTADAGDRLVVHDWLAERQLSGWYEPARRWLAAFWSWAVDDANLHSWCREVLISS